MVNIFLYLIKTVNPQIQESQQTLSIRNVKKTTHRYTIIQFLKTVIYKKNLKKSQRKDTLSVESKNKDVISAVIGNNRS